jgi:hypothetical protein
MAAQKKATKTTTRKKKGSSGKLLKDLAPGDRPARNIKGGSIPHSYRGFANLIRDEIMI